VDTPDSFALESALEARGWGGLDAIFNTHHHSVCVCVCARVVSAFVCGCGVRLCVGVVVCGVRGGGVWCAFVSVCARLRSVCVNH